MTALPTGVSRKTRWTRRLPFLWLIAPAALFTVIMTAFPILQVVHLSTREFVIGFRSVYTGLDNYREMLADPIFWSGMRVTFELYFLSLAAQLVIGLYLAILLHRALKGSRLLRTVLLSPLAMPPVAVGMMWLILLDPSFGPVNYLLELVGMNKSLFLASPRLVVQTLAAIDTWQYTPFVTLILLGGLQALPEEPYEAAEIDGASRAQRFWRITLPLLRPSIITASILRSVDLLRFFDTIYITTQGGPGTASTTLNIYAYRTGFVFFRMGYASALMLTLMVMVLAITFLLNGVRRRFQ
ncbi:MAG: sugar ABC transporter permease [Spirochaetaceae bacterium]|nr:MAG: sugar ABC transporter permease [Spirochaetaceae bacterium]